MSSIFGEISAVRAGLITFMPEGKGEEALDAASADVIAQGKVIHRDVKNATPADRVWKVTGTTGTEVGQIGLSTKAKAAGETKVVGIWGAGFRALVTLDGACAPGAFVAPSTTNAGNVEEYTDAVAAASDISKQNLKFARFIRIAKFANSNDGNHALAAGQDGDIIEVEFV